MITEHVYENIKQDRERSYIITERHIANFERAISDMQNIFLDIFSNYEMDFGNDDLNTRHYGSGSR